MGDLFDEDKNGIRNDIDDLVASLDIDSLISTLEEVDKDSKSEGVNSSYEGNVVAKQKIDKLLSGIDVSTAIKEQLVLRVKPLKIENLYEHYLLQARLCGVPIEVFLGTEVEDYEAPTARQNEDSINDIENMERRKDIGEVFEDFSQDLRNSILNPNIEDDEGDLILSTKDVTFTNITEEEEVEEELIDKTESTLDIFKELEDEVKDTNAEQLDTDNLIDIDIKDENRTPEDLEPVTIVQPLTERDNSEELDLMLKEISQLSTNLSPKSTRGGELSKTYSLEQLKSKTGGTSEV